MNAFEIFMIAIAVTLMFMVIAVGNKFNSERNYFVSICMDNNITLPSRYDEIIKDIKIKKYAKSIEKE